MKYRPQRGSYAESMAEIVIVPDSLRAFAAELKTSVERLEVKPYCYDDRNGWKTYIVTVDGQAVGFTDGPCTENG
jgi:hypothetical protein